MSYVGYYKNDMFDVYINMSIDIYDILDMMMVTWKFLREKRSVSTISVQNKQEDGGKTRDQRT